MSSSGIISSNNGKIFDELLPNPYPYPAFPPSLAQVLATDNNAGNQNIENLFQLETSNVVQQAQIGGHLTIGGTPSNPGSGGDLRIQGATAKGSILAGDGTSTVELPVGVNGLVLTTNSATATGLEWAVGGGGGGVASVSAGDNITVSGTVSNPIVAVANPLNATLNVATQNITATTGIASFTGASSVANISENGVSAYDAITATTLSTLAKTGLTTATLADSMSATPTGLSKTLGATPLTLSSSTAGIQLTPASATSCNVSVDGTGTFSVSQTSTGGASQPAVSIINTNGGVNAVHLDLYKNSGSPATNDGIAGLSYHANNASGTKVEYARIQADQRDTTAGSENGSVSVYVATNSPTPAEYMRFNGTTNTTEMYKAVETRGNFLQNTTAGQSLTLYQSANSGNITLNNVGTSGAINLLTNSGSINHTANQSVNIVASIGTIGLTASTTDGVKVAQSSGARTQLRTTIAPTYATQPVDFYPAVNVDNGNASNISLDLPKVQYQNLVLMNMGITPATSWNDVGSANGNADSMYLASGGYVWLGVGPNVYITDTGFSTIYQTISLSGSSGGGGSTRALSFWEYGGFVYIGGDFQSVNGNAQPQYGLTRIYLGGGVGLYVEDPVYDSVSNDYGVNGVVEAVCEYGGVIYVGGTFNSLSASGATADYIFRLENPTIPGGGQVYSSNLGTLATNSTVYALSNGGTFLFVGGGFTTISGTPYNYIAVYDGNNWSNVDGNSFSGPVYALSQSTLSSNMLVGGSFSHSGLSNVCYIDLTTPSNPAISPGSITPSSIPKYGVFGGGGVDIINSNDSSTYKSSSFTNWDYIGQSLGGTTPSTIFYYSSAPYVSYASHPSVRTNTVNPQSATFSLPSTNFLYQGVAYQNISLGPKYTAQAFVADATATYYIPVGTPICSFS